VPLFVILGTSFIFELSSHFDRRGVIAAIAVLLAAVPALSMSLRINSHDVDPHTIIPSIIAASGARVVYDRYSDYQRNGRRILGLRMRPTKDTADIVVTANLAYTLRVLSGAERLSSDEQCGQLSVAFHAASS
jgi:hypothetical protein